MWPSRGVWLVAGQHLLTDHSSDSIVHGMIAASSVSITHRPPISRIHQLTG